MRLILFLSFAALAGAALTIPAPWVPDLGDGTYKNPVLCADYSDPDAIRVGDDYWMTASSFNQVPGLPILHSKDLVNWSLVTHALPRLVPEDAFRVPQHGKGVWAPAIRFHGGKYWIVYPDPDFGLYVTTAIDPAGEWSAPFLLKAGKGLIDPCPFWDDDGRLYLIHGWARSRAGIANLLTLHELSPDGTKILDAGKNIQTTDGKANDVGTVIIDANKLPGWTTLEGPKLYKRHGWYYVFAPAGGVTNGYQAVFRAKNIYGPYESRVVLDQGTTAINGPHQGAWVDTSTGEDWFLHFQDRGPFGRVVHLQPMTWHDDWPVIGADPDGDGKGEPVLTHHKPNVGRTWPITVPPTTDEFTATRLGLQWQWQANPGENWFSLTANPGALRLFAQPAPKSGNLYDAPHLLLQKFPAEEFSVTTRVDLTSATEGDRAGLIVFGYDYAWIGIKQVKSSLLLVHAVRREAVKSQPEEESLPFGLSHLSIQVRVTVTAGGKCQFAYSYDGVSFTNIGEPFTATVGRWVGAKVGLFAAGSAGAYADFDFFRVTPVQK